MPLPNPPITDEFIAKRDQQHTTTRRLLMLVAGVILVAAGLALGPVPVLPGFPLTMLGLLLLTGASETMRRLVNWGDTKLPRSLRVFIRRFRRQAR